MLPFDLGLEPSQVESISPGIARKVKGIHLRWIDEYSRRVSVLF